ncbi:hypothetical protein [Neisseria benedictiae]|uniref:hypothetical protein n=1 Tax=Neisseria benedictiae TaxID=2830649 RepID=UPI002657DCB9|nr:hypothetical protein [Neisseria benedictiae]
MQKYSVIPAKAGIQNVKSKETVLSDKFPHRQTWIPACAGMTGFLFLIFCFWGMTGFEIASIYRVKRKLNVAEIYPKSQQLFRVIPTKAGI